MYRFKVSFQLLIGFLCLLHYASSPAAEIEGFFFSEAEKVYIQTLRNAEQIPIQHAEEITARKPVMHATDQIAQSTGKSVVEKEITLDLKIQTVDGKTWIRENGSMRQVLSVNKPDLLLPNLKAITVTIHHSKE